MDQESAQLIQILYSRSEQLPHLTVVLGFTLTAAAMLLLSIAQLWLPKKKGIKIEQESDMVDSVEEKKAA